MITQLQCDTSGAAWRQPNRSTLDIALGVLIGRHRYGREQAFADLVAASKHWDIDVVNVARGLIVATQGTVHQLAHASAAHEAALHWADIDSTAPAV